MERKIASTITTHGAGGVSEGRKTIAAAKGNA